LLEKHDHETHYRIKLKNSLEHLTHLR